VRLVGSEPVATPAVSPQRQTARVHLRPRYAGEVPSAATTPPDGGRELGPVPAVQVRGHRGCGCQRRARAQEAPPALWLREHRRRSQEDEAESKAGQEDEAGLCSAVSASWSPRLAPGAHRAPGGALVASGGGDHLPLLVDHPVPAAPPTAASARRRRVPWRGGDAVPRAQRRALRGAVRGLPRSGARPRRRGVAQRSRRQRDDALLTGAALRPGLGRRRRARADLRRQRRRARQRARAGDREAGHVPVQGHCRQGGGDRDGVRLIRARHGARLPPRRQGRARGVGPASRAPVLPHHLQAVKRVVH
jgi:hypothetical protein